MDELEKLENILNEKKKLLLLKEKKLKSYEKKRNVRHDAVLRNISTDDNIRSKVDNSKTETKKDKLTKNVIFKDLKKVGNKIIPETSDNPKSEALQAPVCIVDDSASNTVSVANKCETISTLNPTPLSPSNISRNYCGSPSTTIIKTKMACSTPYNAKVGKTHNYVDDDIFADCDLTGIFENIEMMEAKKEQDQSAISVIEPNNNSPDKHFADNSFMTVETLGTVIGTNHSLYNIPENVNVLAVSATALKDGSIYLVTVCQHHISLWKRSSCNVMDYERISEQKFNHSVERAFLYPLNSETGITFFLISISNKATFLSVISQSEEKKLHLISKNYNDVVICSLCSLIGCPVEPWSVAVAVSKCSNVCCTNNKEMRTLCLMCIDVMFSKRKNDWQLKIEFLTRELPLQQISFMQRFSSDDANDRQSLLIYHESGAQFGVIDLCEFVILDKFTLDIPCDLNHKWNIVWTNVINDYFFIIVETGDSLFIATTDPSMSKMDKFHTWTLSNKTNVKNEKPPVVTRISDEFIVLFSNGSYYQLPSPSLT